MKCSRCGRDGGDPEPGEKSPKEWGYFGISGSGIPDMVLCQLCTMVVLAGMMLADDLSSQVGKMFRDMARGRQN